MHMQSVGFFYQQSRAIVTLTVTWKPEQFEFIAELKLLAKESTKKELREETASQISVVGNPPAAWIPIYFLMADMMKLFGDNSLGDLQFFQSKLSVVCYSRTHRIVFKWSLLSQPLNNFCYECLVKKYVLKQIFWYLPLYHPTVVQRKTRLPYKNTVMSCLTGEEIVSTSRDLLSS